MQHYHFIGIGGISMSGIAMILKSKGHEVTGSDRAPSDLTRRLEEAGIPVSYGQKAENITQDIDTVVYTAAIHEDNPELIEARKKCPRVIERARMLGELLDQYPIPIAVAGTHGKTSTSSMLANIYLCAGLDPSFAIGGILQSTGTNYHIGRQDRMIIEACEYSDSFLHFHPLYNIITNMEAEHLDYFKTFDNMKASFKKYVQGMKDGGVLFTSPELKEFFKDTGRTIVSAQVADDPSACTADVVATHIEHHTDALGSSFDVIYKGSLLGRADLYVPGRHMIYDALLAISEALYEKVPFEAIQAGIASYKSTHKRFEYRGDFCGVKVVDDYAHHPSEIRATLKAAREVPMRELTVVFQPHTYSRTKAFFHDFVDALSLADHIVLADIYAAREKDDGTVSSKMLADALKEAGADAYYVGSFDEIEKFLEKTLSPGDMLITMGAGNVADIGTDLLAKK